MSHVPTLLTAGKIASELGVSINRIVYLLATRPHIQPVARAGTLRLYDRIGLAKIRHEINAMDAKRAAREEVADA